jgi:hypothetical protein
MTRFATYAFCAAVMTVFCVTVPGWAQSPGDIRMTTTTEVAVPGHLLEPGTYWFRRAMADQPTVYWIVGDDGQFIAFADVIPIRRMESGDTQVEVSAPDAAGVRVVKAWYAAGENDGYEWVYPKGDIRKLDRIAEMRARSSGYAAGQQ